jgi:peptidoglycan/xylan/chitin deacetylase (PgdA/CDA1 family)
VSARFRPVIICYHAVTEGAPHRLAVSRRALERHVRSVLRRGYVPGTAADVVDGRRRLLHVTFDDAFRSVELALPVLESLRVPVTVFACTAMADKGSSLDIRELADEVAADPRAYSTMDWDALRALIERGVEVGSHTVTHARLSRIADDELERELAESRLRLEDELRRPCRFLAYPYGDTDDRVRNAARQAGYDAAFALQVRRSRIDSWSLPRVDLYRDDHVVRALLKTSPAYRPLSAVLRRVR